MKEFRYNKKRTILKKYIVTSLLFSCLFLAVSCNNKEVKENPVFATHLPETKQYKDEVVKQLASADKSKLIYYFDSYEEIDGKNYLHVSIEGDNLKAIVPMLVKEWDLTLQPIKEFKGKGYGGGELVNLKYEIVQDSTTTEFVYVSATEILD